MRQRARTLNAVKSSLNKQPNICHQFKRRRLLGFWRRMQSPCLPIDIMHLFLRALILVWCTVTALQNSLELLRRRKELHESLCNCMQAYVIACKLMILHAF